jgi:cobalt-zinc-cadmium efflux system protein
MLGVGLTLSFAAVELVGGWWSGSLALMGDAGHMVTDTLALAMGAIAARLSQAPPSRRHTFGLQRAEVLGALLNALFMLAVVAWIAYEAVQRVMTPVTVDGPVVMAIAAAGLVINLLVLRVLHGGEQSLNTRGAILHVMGDLLGSIAALASGAIILATGWVIVDPLLSLGIAGLILASTWRLLQETVHVVMEGVPEHVDVQEVGERIAALEGVRDVHDLHIWTIASGHHALAAHVRIEAMERWPELLADMEQCLRDEFGIDHVTLQPELGYQVTVVDSSALFDSGASSE